MSPNPHPHPPLTPAPNQVESDMDQLDRYLRGRHPDLSFQAMPDGHSHKGYANTHKGSTYSSSSNPLYSSSSSSGNQHHHKGRNSSRPEVRAWAEAGRESAALLRAGVLALRLDEHRKGVSHNPRP